MSKNYNDNWKYLMGLNLKVGDLVYKHSPRKGKDFCIVLDMELDKGMSVKDIQEKYKLSHYTGALDMKYVRCLETGKDYRWVALFNMRTKKQTYYLFAPTYLQSNQVEDLNEHNLYGWTLPE